MPNDAGWLRSLAASFDSAHVEKWRSGEETITLDAATVKTTVGELRRIADRMEILEKGNKDLREQVQQLDRDLYECQNGEPLYPERPEDE